MADNGEEEENPLFAMDFSDEEQSASEAQQKEKVPRDFLSEDAFQATRGEYRAKIEDGELHLHLPPLPSNHPSKQLSQAILHAIEELYFHRRYQDAMALAERALEGDLDAEYRKVLEGYRGRCLVKIGV